MVFSSCFYIFSHTFTFHRKRKNENYDLNIFCSLFGFELVGMLCHDLVTLISHYDAAVSGDRMGDSTLLDSCRRLLSDPKISACGISHSKAVS